MSIAYKTILRNCILPERQKECVIALCSTISKGLNRQLDWYSRNLLPTICVFPALLDAGKAYLTIFTIYAAVNVSVRNGKRLFSFSTCSHSGIIEICHWSLFKETNETGISCSMCEQTEANTNCLYCYTHTKKNDELKF